MSQLEKIYGVHAVEALLRHHPKRVKQIWLAESRSEPRVQTLVELDQLLDGLPVQVKRAFLLAQLDGLTYAQIGAELGISIATVKRHLTKAAMRCSKADSTLASRLPGNTG